MLLLEMTSDWEGVGAPQGRPAAYLVQGFCLIEEPF